MPDLELEGHTNLAEFALGVSSAEPLVASGGRDTNVRVLLEEGCRAGDVLMHVICLFALCNSRMFLVDHVC